MAPVQQLGGKLGPRLAELALKAVLEAQRRGVDTKVRTSMLTQDMFFRIVGDELRNAWGPILQNMLDSEHLPDEVKPLVDFIANGRGQAQALLGLLSTAQGLTGGLGGIIANHLAPVAQADFQAHPNQALTADAAAQIVARGIYPYANGEREAGRVAIDGNRFNHLVELARAWPDLGALMQLHQRGAISTVDATHALVRQGFFPETAGKLLALDRTLVDVAALTSMVVRGVVSQETGRAKAKTIGYAASDFDLLVKVTGNPPGPMDLLTAYRRGIIDRERLHHGIRQGDLKNEWIDVIEALRYEPLSPAGAVEAAVEGHLTQAEAKHLWTVGGMRPEDFDTAYETAGAPPGVQQMLELWVRGDITKAQVVQSIRESRLKPKYTDIVLKLARRLPPMDNIRMSLRDGVITKEQAIERLMDLGYNHADAAMLAGQAVASKHQTERDLTKAEITELYLLRGIDRGRAVAMLKDLGYDDQESGWVLSIADLKRKRADQNAVMSVIRSKFVARKIEAQVAATQLDSAGVPADQRDQAINLWTLERDANQAQLTVAQITAALKKGFMEVPEARAAIAAHGYDTHEQDIILRLAGANV